MRLLNSILLTFLCYGLLGQTSPDKTKGLISIADLKSKYDSVIVFTKECYWTDHQRFYILGQSKDQWTRTTIEYQFKGRDKKDKIVGTKRGTSQLIPSQKMKSLFAFWESNEFFKLNSDSIEKHSYTDKNGNKILNYMSDGCTDQFEMQFKEKLVQFKSYNPDEYQKKIFTKDRDKFIKCRDYFIKSFGE